MKDRQAKMPFSLILFISLLSNHLALGSSKFALHADGISQWSQNLRVLSSRNCYVLNFGFENVHSFEAPQIMMSLKKEKIFSFHQMWKQSPGNCFIVLVGEKYFQSVDKISEMLEQIIQELRIVKILKIFFFESKTEKLPETKTFTQAKVLN